MKTDIMLEKLSKTLPGGLGKLHANMIDALLDKHSESCLDVGCGRGAFTSMRNYYSVGVDIFAPNLPIARDKGYYREVLQCDVNYLPFGPKSFDSVVCVEVIEHLEKQAGQELLRNLEGIARRQVIIMTPWGFDELKERHDNVHLNHLSGWLPDEFTSMGYEVYPFYYPRYPAGNHPAQIIGRYALLPVLYPLIRANPDKWVQDFAAVKSMN